MMDAWFETESEAIAYLKAKMNITDAEAMSVVSNEEDNE